MLSVAHCAGKPTQIYIAPPARDSAVCGLTDDQRESAVLSQMVGWHGPADWRSRGALWCAEIAVSYARDCTVRYRLHVLTDSPLALPDLRRAMGQVAGAFAPLAELLNGWPSMFAVLLVALVAEPRSTRRCKTVQQIADQRTPAAIVRRASRARKST